MNYTEVCLEGFGYSLPSHVATSVSIEERLSDLYLKIGLKPGRLQELTGVQERRLWPVGTNPSKVAAEAAEKIFAEGAIDRSSIDLIIHAGVCRDALEPATASVVHHLLQLKPACLAFDVSNACLGFLNAMTIAANMIELGQIQNALVVSGENAGPLYADTIQALINDPEAEHFRKRVVNLTLGSGAIAMVLTARKHSKTGHRLLGGAGRAHTESHNLCRGYGDVYHLSMETDPVPLMRDGLMLAHATWPMVLDTLKWDHGTPTHVFTHQVSRSHQDKILEILNLADRKTYSEISWLGNTGSVAAPLSLILAAESGKLKAGDHIAILGIGSGLNTMMLGVEW